MDLWPDDFERELVDAVRQLLSRHCSIEAVRKAHGQPDGLVSGLWRAAVEQGWFLLAASEEQGGLAGKIYQTAMILEELGRSLAPGPWIGTAVAAIYLRGEEGQRARDGARIGLALDPSRLPDRPRRTATGLAGLCPLVQHAQAVDALLVAVDTQLWWVEGAALEPREALDPGLRLADVRLDSATARPLDVAIDDVLPAVDILAAAQAVGVAAGALELGKDYAMVREQFGQPIGAFQVIKHRLANAAARVEQARALASVAAVQLHEEGTAAARRMCQGAWILAAGNARANADDAVRVHGAMGFTWECDAHLFLKRALTLRHVRTALDAALDEYGAGIG